MTLLEAMLKADMDKERIADLAALTPRAISSYLYKERRPSKLNRSRIEKILNAEIDWGYQRARTKTNSVCKGS